MNLTVCQKYRFFSVLAAIIRESSDKQLVLRIVKPLPIVYQLDRVAPKARESGECQQLIGYINTRKNTIFFHVCCYGFSQGQKSLYNTAVYVINIYILYGFRSNTQEYGKILTKFWRPKDTRVICLEKHCPFVLLRAKTFWI